MGVRRDEGTDDRIHCVNQSELDTSKVNYFDNEIAVKVNCSNEQGSTSFLKFDIFVTC